MFRDGHQCVFKCPFSPVSCLHIYSTRPPSETLSPRRSSRLHPHALGLCGACCNPFGVLRSFAGGSCASRQVDKAAVAASTLSLSPQQLGEGDTLDEDVAREVERIGQGGGNGDVVKVTSTGISGHVLPLGPLVSDGRVSPHSILVGVLQAGEIMIFWLPEVEPALRGSYV